MAAKKVTTPKGRCSWPKLLVPESMDEGQKKKYSITVIFDEAARQTPEYQALQDAVIECAKSAFGDKAVAMLASGSVRSPFRKDGEEKGYGEGTHFITARSESKPGVVAPYAGEDGRPALFTDEQVAKELYPGCYVRAALSVFSYSGKTKGVSFALNAVQKLGEGDRLDGRKKAEDEFDAVVTEVAKLDDVL